MLLAAKPNNKSQKGVRPMDSDFTRISIYVPKSKQSEQPLERLYQLGQKRDRSLNYMIVQAVLDYVKREERKAKA